MKFKFYLLGIFICCSSLTSFAGRESEGGHESCQEYTQIVMKVGETLSLYLDQHEDTFNDPIIDLRYLIALSREVKCLPVVDLDRTLRSFPETKMSHLKYSDWDQLLRRQKIELAIHELAVIASYDEDGYYTNSYILIKIIKDVQFGIGEELKAETFIKNSLSGTYIKPFAELDGNEYRIAFFASGKNYREFLARVCKFLGKVQPRSYSSTKRNDEAVVVLDVYGNIYRVLEQGEKQHLKLSLVDVINCRVW